MSRPLPETTVELLDARPAGRPVTTVRSRARRGRLRTPAWVGWLYVAPALLVYAVFVLRPLLLTIEYSLFSWDGIGPSKWVGLDNYSRVFTDPDLVKTIANAFKLIVFFSAIPVLLGLAIAPSTTLRGRRRWGGARGGGAWRS